MAIRYRAAQVDTNEDGSIPRPDNDFSLTTIIPGDSSLPPDIINPSASKNNFDGSPSFQPAATPTSSLGLLTDTAPLTATSSHSKLTSIITPTPTTISVTNTATPTHTSAASSGISPGRLIAAIVIPIGLLAILVPVFTLWFLNYRRKRQEQRYASHRNSNSREPMIQREQFYQVPPNYPQRNTSQRGNPNDGIQAPPSARTRNSLGLFNFDLSPTTSSPPHSPPGTRDSLASPRFGFSIARALEMRRSQPSIIQPHARTSDLRVPRVSSVRSPTGGLQRDSRLSSFDPPPPYASPRPSEVAAARSHFAPLSRIGTRNMTDRSPPQITTQNDGAFEPDRSTYASSDLIADPATYGRVHTRSTSPSLEWPSPPQAQGVVARKPVPTQAAQIQSQATSPENASHLNGPFSSYLPDRISDVSGFSIDTTQWEDPPRQISVVSSINSHVGEGESSRIHPHNLI